MGNKLKTSLYIVTWLGIIGSLFFMYHQSQTIADADVV